MGKFQILKEFWEFLKSRRKFWLIPVVAVLLILSVFVVLAESSAIAPFIYAIF